MAEQSLLRNVVSEKFQDKKIKLILNGMVWSSCDTMDVEFRYKELEDCGFNECVIDKLEELFRKGKLSVDDLDGGILEALKEYPVGTALTILNEFQDSCLLHVSNKSAYLRGIMKLYSRNTKIFTYIKFERPNENIGKTTLNESLSNFDDSQTDYDSKAPADYGLSEDIEIQLKELFITGQLSVSDQDEKTSAALRVCHVDNDLTALKEFVHNGFENVSEKSDYSSADSEKCSQSDKFSCHDMASASRDSEEKATEGVMDRTLPKSNFMDKDNNFKIFSNYGMSESVVSKLKELFTTGKISLSDLDENTLTKLKECSIDGALSALKEFEKSNDECVSSRRTHLHVIVEKYSQKTELSSKGKILNELEGETTESVNVSLYKAMDTPDWNFMDVDSKCNAFIEYGLSESIVKMLKDLSEAGKLSISDLDKKTIGTLKECSAASALLALNEFTNSNLDHISNKMAYLCGIVKWCCQKTKVDIQAGVSRISDKVMIKSISDRKVPNLDSKYVDSKCKELKDYGLDVIIVNELKKLLITRNISFSDLDNMALGSLKKLPVSGALTVLKELKNSRFLHVSNKAAYLCGIIKAHSQKINLQQKALALKRSSKVGINPELDSRPTKRRRTSPNIGFEVFVEKIPKSMCENELIPVFENYGQIWDFRLLMDHLTGQNRGYAFVKYCFREDAQAAVEKLNNYEIERGHNLKVSISVSNLRLFAGNIPKNKSKEDIFEEFRKLTTGLVDVIICNFDDKRRNSGFCFLEYESYKATTLAKMKLRVGNVSVWGCDIIFD